MAVFEERIVQLWNVAWLDIRYKRFPKYLWSWYLMVM
jgi:hypothetical protein